MNSNPKQQETEPNPDNAKHSTAERIGNLLIIAAIIYSIITIAMLFAGNPTPLYETDNPWSYSVKQGYTWVMVATVLNLVWFLIRDARQNWQSHQDRQRNVLTAAVSPEEQARQKRKLWGDVCLSVSAVMTAYLIFKAGVALFIGGSLAEMAMPLTAEVAAAHAAQTLTIYAVCTAYIANRGLKLFLRTKGSQNP